MTKDEMKNVVGGLRNEECIMTVHYSNGGVGSGSYILSGSSGANNLCVHWIETGQVSSCGYDCMGDGVG